MNLMLTRNLQWQLDLEANCQGPEGEIESNHENGREFVGITRTSYQNLMLERWILRTEKSTIWHKLLLPQEVLRHEVD